ncbi:MAG: YceH family protein [Pseudomonadota bacterium]
MTPQLSPNEARVIAAMVEKSIATPQYYPMTVNAIMLACNQKSSRSPVMNLSEGDVGAALNSLEQNKLVARDDFGGRVAKWRHHFHNQLLLKPPVMAVLATLILRGPQTLSELRANAVGLGGPSDADGVNQALQDLADRAQPMATLLPRAVGQSSLRYAHTLSGEVATPFSPEQTSPAATVATTAGGEKISLADLYERIRVLEAKVVELEQRQTSAE